MMTGELPAEARDSHRQLLLHKLHDVGQSLPRIITADVADINAANLLLTSLPPEALCSFQVNSAL